MGFHRLVLFCTTPSYIFVTVQQLYNDVTNFSFTLDTLFL